MKQVSVIIPLYNVEKYISECLNSVVKQSLQNIEIICVNDGSTDKSAEIIEAYAQKDERIILINKENGGVSSARNAGLEIATGKYIYFMDSDDIIKENALDLLYNIAEKENLDTIFFDADSFYENGDLEISHKSYTEYYHRKCNYDSIMSGIDLTVQMILNKEFRPAVCLQFNRKNIIADNNLSFFTGIIHEDNLFTLELTMYSKRAKYVSETLYLRRLREDSIMTARNISKGCYGYFICIKELFPKIAHLIPEKEQRNAYLQQLRNMRSTSVKDICYIYKEGTDLPTMNSTEEEVLFELLIADYAALVYQKDNQISTLKNASINKEAYIHDLNKKIDSLKLDIQYMNSDLKNLNNSLQRLQNSNSYKIGRMITFLPRALLSIRKRVKQCLFRLL